MTQLKHPFVSYTLVFVQFFTLGALLLTGPWLASLQGVIWQVAGILLGLWALQTMHWGRFNIIPDPRPDSSLVQAGPYRLIRHPMYAAILLFFIPLVLEAPSMLRWGLLGILVVDLLIKLHYEESLLKIQFSDYADYQTRSRKIIPFIY